MDRKTQVNTIQSGLPRPVLDAAFAVMIAAAVCSHHTIQEWLYNHAPIPFAIITTLGMVIIYYAFLRGMKPLHHPFTVLWWIAIAANILGFLFGRQASRGVGYNRNIITAYIPSPGNPYLHLVPGAPWPGRLMDGYPHSCLESGAGLVLRGRTAQERLGTGGDGNHHDRHRTLVCMGTNARASLIISNTF